MRFFLLLLIITFLVLCGVCLALHYQVFVPQRDPNYHLSILLIANVLLAVLSLANYFIILDGLKNDNPNALVRAKTGGMMLKFFVAIGALLVYIFINHRVTVHKPTIYVFMGMYVVYAIAEATTLSKVVKNP